MTRGALYQEKIHSKQIKERKTNIVVSTNTERWEWAKEDLREWREIPGWGKAMRGFRLPQMNKIKWWIK